MIGTLVLWMALGGVAAAGYLSSGDMTLSLSINALARTRITDNG